MLLQVGNEGAVHNNMGTLCRKLKEYACAAEAYRLAIAADPAQAVFRYNLGRVLEEFPDQSEPALVEYYTAARLKPNFQHAYHRIAVLQLKRNATASLEAARTALAMDPTDPWLHYRVGEAYTELGHYQEALITHKAALHHANDIAVEAEIFYSALHLEQFLCDWRDHALRQRQVVDVVARELASLMPDEAPAIRPLQSLLYLPAAQLSAVTRQFASWVTHAVAPVAPAFLQESPKPPSDAPVRRVVRVGYVSADLNEHPVGQLLRSVPRLHNRSRVEVHVYSLSSDPESLVYQAFKRAADSFVDVSGQSFLQVASRIRDDNIQILVDLMGYTKRNMNEIFALRPAPIQVAYMGWPASSFAPYIDYIVADRVVAPPHQLGKLFSEKVMYMPGSYYVGDYHSSSVRPKAHEERRTLQSVEALPDLSRSTFVFCSFNQHYKIDVEIFHTWANILRRVPDSVLWLLDWGGHALQNLRDEMAACGVSPKRIHFSKLVSKEAHMTRARYGHLFLDTPTYNGHTSAMDALWSGVPVLTMPLDKMPSRVCASLVAALGHFPELVVQSMREYEDRAISLAKSYQRASPGISTFYDGLASRVRSATTWHTEPHRSGGVFDTTKWVHDFENRLSQAWEMHASGLSPQHILGESQMSTVRMAQTECGV